MRRVSNLPDLIFPIAILTSLFVPAFADIETIGGLPTRGSVQQPGGGPGWGGAGDQRVTVKPGQSFTNANGVTITTDINSQGNASINVGGPTRQTTSVRTKTGWKGTVTGIKIDDVVQLTASNHAKIQGDGGTVQGGGNSLIEVKDTGPNGMPTKVELSSGVTGDVPDGSGIVLHTSVQLDGDVELTA